MQEELADFVSMITKMLDGDTDAIANFGEAPIDAVAAQTSGVPADEINPLEVLTEALSQSELAPEQQTAVMEAVTEAMTGYGAPEAGYNPEQLAQIFAQGINVTIEEGDKITVDNSLYVDGDVKGGITQHNQTDIVEADHGAVVADGAYDSNFQTGENNTQLNDVEADNVVSGDNNTVASEGSVIGNENVNANEIYDSEFGEGNQDRSVAVDAKITDSFTDDDNTDYSHSDDDVVKTHVDIDTGYGHEAPTYEPEHGYEEAKPVPTYDDDHHNEPDYHEVD